MFEDLKHHPAHYLILFLWLSSAGVVFLFLPAVYIARLTVIVLAIFGYIAWGIWHHMIHKNLTFVVVLEYLLVGMLALLVSLFVLYNS